MAKKIVISCGPIPARLDSVKFITNKFKGGLAFKTAQSFIDDAECNNSYDVTVIIWNGTTLPEVSGKPDYWNRPYVHIVSVLDVMDYCKWFTENADQYDVFILAAAVANLMPSNPWEGKFPSHNYKVGDKFDIQFEIAPRAIDIIKTINPRASLIGYKLFDGTEDELINAARLTQKESRANIIFANAPATAKEKKLAVMADNSVVPCTFDEHIELMKQQINSHYFMTRIVDADDIDNDIDVREALAVVKMYEKTFDGFGTVAVPVKNHNGWFATTARGHKGDPVIVYKVDKANREIYASNKATFNAPTLWAALNGRNDVIVVHRHDDDPHYNHADKCDSVCLSYLFPGTVEEMDRIADMVQERGELPYRIGLYHHGDISILPIEAPDWNKYYEQFPSRYFKKPEQDSERYSVDVAGQETLELGANKTSDAKYVYDKYVHCPTAINLTEEELFTKHYDIVYAWNAINYFSLDFLRKILDCTDSFVANSFLESPEEKVTDEEAVVTSAGDKIVHHNLRLKDDALVRHSFYAHTAQDYRDLGLALQPYGKNSVMVRKDNSSSNKGE